MLEIRVQRLVYSCLYDEAEMAELQKAQEADVFSTGFIPNDAVVSLGPKIVFCFNPTKLNKPEVLSGVKEVLSMLPKKFHVGMPISYMKYTEGMYLWGSVKAIKGLFCLAQALGLAGLCHLDHETEQDTLNPRVWLKI